jgi:SSS family solute:Na+ symporter
MLLWFVILYLMVSVGIGLFAATRVHNAKDFAVAGRRLPLPVVTATVFATWFGAEAVFGVSATFVKDGLGGVVADPFGSSMCLIIAGIIFSRYLYKLNILTLGDFYRMRYNRTVEVLTTICIVLSYLGWVAAQIKALGLIFYVVTDGAVSQEAGMILGAAIVLSYTIFGGMFSVAILDFVQMAVSMGGLLFIAWTVSGKVGGGATAVIDHASAAGKLEVLPRPRPLAVARLHRHLDDHDAGLDPAAGRVPARHLGEERQALPCGAPCLAPRSISASPSCRCSSPTRRR